MKINKIGILGLGVVMLLACQVFAQETVGSVPDLAPLVKSFIGAGEETLGPAKYPKFQDSTGEEACLMRLDAISQQEGCPAISGAARCNGSAQDVSINGSSKTITVDIPAEYRQGHVVITWTLRVVGAPHVWDAWKDNDEGLCSVFHGTVYQNFLAGEAQSYVKINGTNLQSSSLTMTIPSAGIYEETIISDPTHTGTYVLDPAMFGGSLPANVSFSVFWQNKTSMKLVSDANMRSVVVMITR